MSENDENDGIVRYAMEFGSPWLDGPSHVPDSPALARRDRFEHDFRDVLLQGLGPKCAMERGLERTYGFIHREDAGMTPRDVASIRDWLVLQDVKCVVTLGPLEPGETVDFLSPLAGERLIIHCREEQVGWCVLLPEAGTTLWFHLSAANVSSLSIRTVACACIGDSEIAAPRLPLLFPTFVSFRAFRGSSFLVPGRNGCLSHGITAAHRA